MYSLGEEGQGLVEYSLIILFIALVAIIAMTFFRDTLLGYYLSIVSAWPT
ncbi:MAG: Flp family type IVb pilin [Chloroflexota bacterium]|nr:Flp family type IVb pilin [Chloroflexota bacterium]